VQIWLYEQTDLRIEGRIIVFLLIIKGFDEFMSVVLDDAEEINSKIGFCCFNQGTRCFNQGTRVPLGRVLLKGSIKSDKGSIKSDKGDNITLLCAAPVAA
jgi:hypothetical protein